MPRSWLVAAVRAAGAMLSATRLPATELAAKMARGVPQANGEVAVEPLMDLSHVARAVVYMASLPLDANVQFMTVMATTMPLHRPRLASGTG